MLLHVDLADVVQILSTQIFGWSFFVAWTIVVSYNNLGWTLKGIASKHASVCWMLLVFKMQDSDLVSNAFWHACSCCPCTKVPWLLARIGVCCWILMTLLGHVTSFDAVQPDDCVLFGICLQFHQRKASKGCARTKMRNLKRIEP